MATPRKDCKETHRQEDVLFGNIIGTGPILVTDIKDPETDKVYRGCGWNRNDANRKAEENFRKGESTSDAGGCYLTTACTVAEGLPDDCYQLQVLRDIRDNTLMRDSEGRRLVASYYALAPEIVGAINKRRDAREIWGQCLHRYKRRRIAGDVRNASGGDKTLRMDDLTPCRIVFELGSFYFVFFPE